MPAPRGIGKSPIRPKPYVPTKQTVTSLEVTDQVESVELIFRQRRELELGLVTKLARILGQQPKLRLSRTRRLKIIFLDQL